MGFWLLLKSVFIRGKLYPVHVNMNASSWGRKKERGEWTRMLCAKSRLWMKSPLGWNLNCFQETCWVAQDRSFHLYLTFLICTMGIIIPLSLTCCDKVLQEGTDSEKVLRVCFSRYPCIISATLLQRAFMGLCNEPAWGWARGYGYLWRVTVRWLLTLWCY